MQCLYLLYPESDFETKSQRWNPILVLLPGGNSINGACSVLFNWSDFFMFPEEFVILLYVGRVCVDSIHGIKYCMSDHDRCS